MTSSAAVFRLGPDREGAPVVEVPLQHLRFHPRNIRTNLGDITALAESIRHEGVLVPLMAEKRPGGGLQLLHGHRRWAAADLAGLRRAGPEFNYSVESLAQRLGVSEQTVRDWRAGRAGPAGVHVAAPAPTRPPTAGAPRRRVRKDAGRPKPSAPRFRPAVVHGLLQRLDRGEIAADDVVAHLREVLGTWAPNPPKAKP